MIELRSESWVQRRAADGLKKIEDVHQAHSWGWLLTCCMCAAGHDRAAVEGLGAAASCRWAQEDRGGAPGGQAGAHGAAGCPGGQSGRGQGGELEPILLGKEPT